MTDKTSGLKDVYWTTRDIMSKNLETYGADDETALVETVTFVVETLSKMFGTERDMRLLLASVALSAAHSESYERGLPVIVDISPSTLLTMADRVAGEEMGL